MEVLCFKISGKLAHFRKYYANNTAFSFTIPPRTTLMGIVAAAMGLERDSYYELLSSENIHFGVRVLTPLKKSFHRLNFLSIKTLGDFSKKMSSDFRGEGGRIQTPFEVVSGWDLTKDDVVYQVFISPTELGVKVFESIKSHFLNANPVFNITLGVANFGATINEVFLSATSERSEFETDSYVLIHSAIPVDHVKDLKFDKEDFGSYNFVEEDMMPGDFVSNDNREVRKMNRLLFSTSANPLRVKLNSPAIKLNLPEGEISFQFMDA
jgi:CRISPR-associated protein Cas5h